MEASFSDSELDNVYTGSLRNHSHFFVSTPHYRYSMYDLLASPVPPRALLETQTNGSGSTDGSSHTSTEKLDCLIDPQDSHRYENRDSLAHDLSFLATMPELCDVTFLVGEDRQPVCGVRAVMAARSR